jgi:acyl-coenzyme A thioesterase PaaI-like protein
VTADDELADELRAVLARLHSTEVDESRVRDATALARTMLELLDGPPRPRWFEGAVVDGRSGRIARHRFADRSLFRGTANPLAPPMTTTTVEGPDGRAVIEGRVTVGRLYEGPPNGVHGGYVAGLFDDILGATQSLIEGPTGLTGTLQVRYRNVTPLDTELVLRAWVHHVSGRRIQSRATCHAGEVLTAEAEALFVRVDMAELARRATEGNGRGEGDEG